MNEIKKECEYADLEPVRVSTQEQLNTIRKVLASEENNGRDQEAMNEIEKMAAIIEADYKEWLDITGCLPDCSSYYYECLGGAKDSAEKLINAGYGDVKQAVREFAEKVKKEFINYLGGRQACNKIDDLVKEVCGE